MRLLLAAAASAFLVALSAPSDAKDMPYRSKVAVKVGQSVLVMGIRHKDCEAPARAFSPLQAAVAEIEARNLFRRWRRHDDKQPLQGRRSRTRRDLHRQEARHGTAEAYGRSRFDYREVIRTESGPGRLAPCATTYGQPPATPRFSGPSGRLQAFDPARTVIPRPVSFRKPWPNARRATYFSRRLFCRNTSSVPTSFFAPPGIAVETTAGGSLAGKLSSRPC